MLTLEVIRECVDRSWLPSENWIASVLQSTWRRFDGPAGVHLQVVLLDQEKHCALHEKFLGDPTPTDVMAFPYHEPDVFAEIVINCDMAEQQAECRNRSPIEEWTLYLVHGALHLLGFDDHEEDSRQEMRWAEAEVLKDVQLPGDQ